MLWKWSVSVVSLVGLLCFQVACGPSFAGRCSFPKRGQCQSFDQGFSINEVKAACDETKKKDPSLEVDYSATEPCPTADLLGVCHSQKSPTQKVTLHYYKVAGGYQTAEDVRKLCTGTFEPAGN